MTVRTKRYQEEHQNLIDIITEMSAQLNVHEISQNARKIKSLLSELLSRLNVHLAVEDKALYPRLLEHEDKNVKSKTQSFIDEMGGIKNDINKYKHKWTTAAKIQQHPKEFVEETKVILKELSRRIDKEDSELFKTVDFN